MANPFIGEIKMFGGTFAPRGWALCNGQLLPILENEALFYLIGTTYGGDGQETFGLPDLRGRLPLHQGQGAGLSNHLIGERSGSEAVTLLTTQIPAHSHTLLGTAEPASTRNPANALLARPDDPLYWDTNADANLAPQFVDPAGNSQPHDNLQPFVCVNFIIALEGIFPQRS